MVKPNAMFGRKGSTAQPVETQGSAGLTTAMVLSIGSPAAGASPTLIARRWISARVHNNDPNRRPG